MSRTRGMLGLIGVLTALCTAAAAPPSAAQDAPSLGLVAQLGVSCLSETPAGGYIVVADDDAVAACCAVLLEVGPENIDFLQAVAIGNVADPRLLVLDSRLVDVLVSCRPQAVERLAALAIAGLGGIAPAAAPVVAPR